MESKGAVVHCWDRPFCPYVTTCACRQSVSRTVVVQPVLWHVSTQLLAAVTPLLTLSLCSWTWWLSGKGELLVVPLPVQRCVRDCLQHYTIAHICKGEKGIRSAQGAVPMPQWPCSWGCSDGSSLVFVCCFSPVHVAMSLPVPKLHLASRLDGRLGSQSIEDIIWEQEEQFI